MVNQLGVYGDIPMLMLHGDPRVKYPTEVEAASRIYNPNAPRFVPAPLGPHKKIVPPSMRPDVAWCTGCRDWHPVECFHKDSSRPNGLQHYCIDARAARRKVGAEKKDVAWRWHRTKK